MPASYSMSWIPKLRRWQKLYKGQRFTISCRQLGVPETKEQSYQAANTWWENKRAEVDGAGRINLVPDESILGPLNQRIDWVDEYDRENPNSVRDVMGGLPKATWDARLKATASKPPALSKSNQAHLDAYLSLEMVRVTTGELSKGECGLTKLCLDYFVEWLDRDSVIAVDEDKWEAWFKHLAGVECSVEYKKKRFRHARNFLEYLASKKVMDMPRNLNHKKHRFGSTVTEIETMTIKEVKTLIGGAPGQLRLHLLLMVNCGFTQIDISDLKRKEVDLKDGTITRKRSKTADHENVPTVTYRLWPATLTALREFMQPTGDRALLTLSGQHWVRPEVKADGSFQRIDMIKSNYVHLQRKTKIRKAIKLLRKTSASLLQSHETHSQQVSLFLGHSPRSIADKHYAKPSQERFDKAVSWLGEQYGW